jgi:hypothetical protein
MDMEQAEALSPENFVDIVEDLPLPSPSPPEIQTAMSSIPSEWQIPLVVLVSRVEKNDLNK